MNLIGVLAIYTIALTPTTAFAQVKDGNGNDLRVGLPTQPTADFNGGRISRGRPARCVLNTDAPRVCTFYPRNGDGSFAIDVDGSAYYAEKASADQIDVDYDNGARMVPQGAFIRSVKDPACWLHGSSRKICIY
jgi:hypothetical protein